MRARNRERERGGERETGTEIPTEKLMVHTAESSCLPDVSSPYSIQMAAHTYTQKHIHYKNKETARVREKSRRSEREKK